MPSDLNPANEKSIIKEHTRGHYIWLFFFRVVAPENPISELYTLG